MIIVADGTDDAEMIREWELSAMLTPVMKQRNKLQKLIIWI